MFNNAQNTTIYGGMFIANSKLGVSLDELYKRVAPNAILNAGGRADAVRCHPGTRKEVIGRIEKWRSDAQNGAAVNRLFWLSGPAGAGKTAIIQTVAESWKACGIDAANFFFFRTDASRNRAHSLVSTLLYQIFDICPNARGVVEGILASKPRILDASIKDQFDQLICSTLRAIIPPFSRSVVLLIDGLDECDSEEKASQGQILHALDMLVRQDDSPFLVLIGSRDEHQIAMAFKELGSTADTIFLDEKYAPADDIRLFVVAEFDKIKRTHRLALQDKNWPSTSDVDGIVTRSSGQFIYAATVMRFISQSSADPILSLARVQGAARIATKSPFSHLDAMYTYILSQAEDQEALKDILRASAVCQNMEYGPNLAGVGIATLLKVLRFHNEQYTTSDIHSCFADITAIARLDKGKLHFYHSSLDDYLRTESRSRGYYVDVDASVIKILPKLWKLTGQEKRTGKNHEDAFDMYLLNAACIFDLASKPLTPNTWSVLISLDPSDHEEFLLVHELRKCCISDDDVVNFKRILRKWSRYYVSLHCSHFMLQTLRRVASGSWRYITMAQVECLHGDVTQNLDVVANILRPQSESDAHENAVWVQELLWHVHREYYARDFNTYLQLIQQWICWALVNDITLANLDDLPHARHFLEQSTKEKTGQ